MYENNEWVENKYEPGLFTFYLENHSSLNPFSRKGPVKNIQFKKTSKK